jgi:molybdenum cofactor cytidylyltransferase
MKPSLVLLGAGLSRRLGEPKALVDLAGSTPLARLWRAARAHCDGQALVVVGASTMGARLEANLPPAARVILNPDPDRGRTGSVQLAARAAPGRDLLLAPLDVPLVPSRVFAHLARAWAEAGAPERGWLAPRTADGRHGHPILVGRALAEDLSLLAPDEALSTLRTRAAPLWAIEVDSPRIHDDLDSPADLALLRAIAADAIGLNLDD